MLVIATLWLLRRNREIATWWIGGLILLIPSSSLFPAADLSADRRMYLPMFCFAAVLGLLLARIKTPAVFAAIALLLAGLSVQRTMVWMTEESLWREAVDRAPGKLRPKLQLARALPAAKGLELLGKARLEAPYEPAIATETGKILLAEGQPDGALEEFGRALALAPDRCAQYEQSRCRAHGARPDRSRTRRFRTRAAHSAVAYGSPREPRETAAETAMRARLCAGCRAACRTCAVICTSVVKFCQSPSS